jgi:hypothetical protein
MALNKNAFPFAQILVIIEKLSTALGLLKAFLSIFKKKK